jgi:hypothetical protein
MAGLGWGLRRGRVSVEGVEDEKLLYGLVGVRGCRGSSKRH